MYEMQKTIGAKLKPEILSVGRLVDLYNANMEELQFCANVNPALERDTEVADMREEALLDFEANLLEQAARIPIPQKADLQGLMDIWQKVSASQSDEYPTPSDRIVMNIFRHLSDNRLESILNVKD